MSIPEYGLACKSRLRNRKVAIAGRKSSFGAETSRRSFVFRFRCDGSAVIVALFCWRKTPKIALGTGVCGFVKTANAPAKIFTFARHG